MLILHIITGLNDGGAEAVLYRLCAQDKTVRHHVVSMMDGGKYGPLLEARGVPVTCLDMMRGRLTLSGVWKLWRLIRKLRPDAIQTWMYHANLVGGVVARLAGRHNVVWGIRNTTLASGESRASTILVAKICALLSSSVPRRIVCCAEKAREVHGGLGYDKLRMQVIPNGYDISVFRPNSKQGLRLRQELGINPSEILVGFVARYDPQKDHDNLLQALARLSAFEDCPRCLLVGTGLEPSNTSLTQRIAALGLQDRILLLGRRNDIPAVMNALDLHIMSSSFGEAFPNVLAEAMACGTPCVSTDVGDAADIVGETGRIVRPRNPEALASAISSLLAEGGTDTWEDRRAAARRRIVERFAIERMIKRYHQVWFDDACHSAAANLQ